MMYLAREKIYTIMLMGRWSSDAFLAYIEKQVKESTLGVSSRMLINDTFFNVPLASQPEESRQTNGKSFHRSSLKKLVPPLGLEPCLPVDHRSPPFGGGWAETVAWPRQLQSLANPGHDSSN